MFITGKIHQMQRSEPNRRGKKIGKMEKSFKSVCSYEAAVALL